MLRMVARVVPLLLIGLWPASPGAAAAAVIPVTTTADGGPGSLRAAFDIANGNTEVDEIVLAAGQTYDITSCGGAGEENANANGDLDHLADQALTIQGNGSTIRNTCEDERVIEAFTNMGPLTLIDVTITGADTPDDGAIYSSSAHVTLTDSVVTGNTVGSGGAGLATGSGDITTIRSVFSGNTAEGGDGGAILSSSSDTISIVSSTFAGNTASEFAGAIYQSSSTSFTVVGSTFSGNKALDGDGGAIRTGSGPISVENSTFSGNSASDQGGAIRGNDPVTLNNTTVTGNTSANASGGGIYNNGNMTTLGNSIIAGNVGGDCGPNLPSALQVSNGYNIDGDGTCGLTGPGDKPSANPMLGPLANNGGLTQTHALPPGSPAIDNGNPAPPGSGGTACAATDQRGIARNCDIGAYELVFCKKVAVNLIGTEGNDTLAGGTEANGVLAFGGNDSVNTGGGNDEVCAGSGNDKVNGGAGKDALYGEVGKDKLNASGGKDLVNGGGGKDTCIGGAGKDRAKACEREKKI